jgi:hypothetical protein
VVWSLNNRVSSIFNPQSIIHPCISLYPPTYESAASYGPPQRPPHPTKLESTCPESGCLYFANIVVAESSLLPFRSSLFIISPFHLLFQSVANLRNPAVLEPLCSQLLVSLSCLVQSGSSSGPAICIPKPLGTSYIPNGMCNDPWTYLLARFLGCASTPTRLAVNSRHKPLWTFGLTIPY